MRSPAPSPTVRRQSPANSGGTFPSQQEGVGTSSLAAAARDGKPPIIRSVILGTATRYLVPLLLLFSFFMALRGHNEPGGGFVGGLVAASALALYSIATSATEAQKLLRLDPQTLIGIGLSMAVGSAAISPIFTGKPFMSPIWTKAEYPVFGKLGTPLLFDLGVYLTVIGVTLLILFTLSED